MTGHATMTRTRTRSKKSPARDAVTRLEQIRNVGPSLAADLRQVGVRVPQDLPGRDPYALYDELCVESGVRHDPCVLDVFISAVRFMEGAPARTRWRYTAERKRVLRQRQVDAVRGSAATSRSAGS
jgi:hypothetical protein